MGQAPPRRTVRHSEPLGHWSVRQQPSRQAPATHSKLLHCSLVVHSAPPARREPSESGRQTFATLRGAVGKKPHAPVGQSAEDSQGSTHTAREPRLTHCRLRQRPGSSPTRVPNT